MPSYSQSALAAFVYHEAVDTGTATDNELLQETCIFLLQ